MKSNLETQEELETICPNPVGVPCQNENSEEIRKEHNRWKDEIRSRKEDKTYSSTYWKNKSSCVAL